MEKRRSGNDCGALIKINGSTSNLDDCGKKGTIPRARSRPLGNGRADGQFHRTGATRRGARAANPWDTWDAVLKAPKDHLPSDLVAHLDATISKSWQRMSAQRRSFLELLSLIDLTAEQASSLAIPEERREIGLNRGACIRRSHTRWGRARQRCPGGFRASAFER